MAIVFAKQRENNNNNLRIGLEERGGKLQSVLETRFIELRN